MVWQCSSTVAWISCKADPALMKRATASGTQTRSMSPTSSRMPPPANGRIRSWASGLGPADNTGNTAQNLPPFAKKPFTAELRNPPSSGSTQDRKCSQPLSSSTGGADNGTAGKRLPNPTNSGTPCAGRLAAGRCVCAPAKRSPGARSAFAPCACGNVKPVGTVVTAQADQPFWAPVDCEMRKITNSAGRTMATPISVITCPRSRTSGGLSSASHFT